MSEEQKPPKDDEPKLPPKIEIKTEHRRKDLEKGKPADKEERPEKDR